MGAKSKIEWTDATWNPITGCSKVSQGCKNCYAERIAPRLKIDFKKIILHKNRLDIPLTWRNPRRVFVCSMSDLFHEDVPEKFIIKIFATMALAQKHTFQILTKRPERMRDFLWRAQYAKLDSDLDISLFDAWRAVYGSGYRSRPWPIPNVWLGVSVEDQATADERIPILLECPSAVRFVSFEPALGPLNLLDLKRPEIFYEEPHGWETWLSKKLYWVICGGESGPNARPMHPDWARTVRDQCLWMNISFFFKQWGEWVPEMQNSSSNCMWGEVVNTYTKKIKSYKFNDHTLVFRVGKKKAGNVLDGEVWEEYPDE